MTLINRIIQSKSSMCLCYNNIIPGKAYNKKNYILVLNFWSNCVWSQHYLFYVYLDCTQYKKSSFWLKKNTAISSQTHNIIATIDKSSAHKNGYIKILKNFNFGGGSWRTGFGIGGFSVQAPDKTQTVFW